MPPQSWQQSPPSPWHQQDHDQPLTGPPPADPDRPAVGFPPGTLFAQPPAGCSWARQATQAPGPVRLPATWPWGLLTVVLGLVFTGGIAAAAQGGSVAGVGPVGVAFLGAMLRLRQVRAKRRRAAGATFAGPARDMRMLPSGEHRALSPAGLVFEQPHCTVGRTSPGGHLQAGLPLADFTVQITGTGHVVVTEDPGVQVFAVPASSVRIITPRWQQKIGGGSILQVGGESWSVQFDRVYQAEARGLGMSPRRALGRAREINRAFTAALTAAGTCDTTQQNR